jgi:MFS family permease
MTEPVSGPAATMTVVAMGLGYSITAGDPTILSANISEVRAGLDMSPSMASFVASLATLTLAAAVLGAGALGDLYGMRRMFIVGLFGAAGFGVLAAAAPNTIVLIAARAGAGVAFAFLLGLSLALINAVFPEERRASAIAMYLGAGFALTTPMPAVGSLLAEHFGWRSGFLVAPSRASSRW